MIGVAISTHRRPAILAKALAHWALHMPDVLVVNHDRDGAGVAATKNLGITALMDAGCEHHFYADDDIWPITPDWARHYIDLPAKHLCHCWGRSRFLAADDRYTVWSWPRGVLLYVTREVIERVGGMRTEFGRWGGEHAEWSRRIHAAGFTAHPFADAASARRGVWHAEDYTRSTPSSVPASARNNAKLRHELYERYRNSTDFVPYNRCAP